MFKTIKRIINWCGEFKGKLYLGFLMTFLSHIFTALPLMVAAYTLGLLITDTNNFDTSLIWKIIIIQIVLVFLRFLFDYFRARLQEPIGYQLTARDRLAVGDALKRVSLGYFSTVSTGNILNSITTGLNTLENMGIRMIDNFVGGYLNFIVILVFLFIFSPLTGTIAIISAFLSFLCLLLISHYSKKNAPVEAKANRDLTGSTIEYARGLAVVKSFGNEGASKKAITEAINDSKNIHLKIEWGYVPGNALHLLALKYGSVAIAFASCISCLNGGSISLMLMFIFYSFTIFASLEPISDSAHTLSVINDAMDQLDALKGDKFIDIDGKDITLDHYDIEFKNVNFAYNNNLVLKNVNFKIKENTSCAIVGPSGSGKSTICSLIARFYDPTSGDIYVGGHNLKEMTCDSLLSNISMVFQNVYLFKDTIRANICFGKVGATEEEMIEAAKKARCHDFIMSLPNGYDTIVGEGGSTLSGGEKQRISIARAILKDAPIIILDEATASIDPENEHLIQAAISSLTKGKTIITIAHRLATIEKANTILVVNDGMIEEQGTHEELMKHEGTYKKFIDIRKNIEGWHINE